MRNSRCIQIIGSLLMAFAMLLPFAGPALSLPVTAMEQTLEVKLPVIMYHSILSSPSRCGTYVISPQEFEADLKYLQANGYTAVTVQDLIEYVYHGAPLPEKPVMLTLDDGYYNNYIYAYPLLKKYNMKAVLSIIGKYTDQYTVSHEENAFYSHVTWSEVIEMSDSGYVEIQNHSYDLHTITKDRSASMRVSGESMNHYETVLFTDSIRLQSLVDNYTRLLPTAYAYPFGLVSKESAGVLKQIGFKATLSCTPGINTITKDPECLFMLKRNLRPHGYSAESLLKIWNK